MRFNLYKNHANTRQTAQPLSPPATIPPIAAVLRRDGLLVDNGAEEVGMGAIKLELGLLGVEDEAGSIKDNVATAWVDDDPIVVGVWTPAKMFVFSFRRRSLPYIYQYDMGYSRARDEGEFVSERSIFVVTIPMTQLQLCRDMYKVCQYLCALSQ